uniref:Uncharacterized protein n=1 Tax=Anguilla anguilla TaxID=7936 RepID=A0A0E9TMT8_ANGAN
MSDVTLLFFLLYGYCSYYYILIRTNDQTCWLANFKRDFMKQQAICVN